MMYLLVIVSLFFVSSRRRHTRCALVTGVQTCALPIFAGCALAAITYFPAFQMLTAAANPAMAAAQAHAAVTVTADPGACSFQFDPVGQNKFERTGCDIAKAALAKAGVSYSSVTRDRADGEAAHVRVGARELIAPEPWRLAEESRAGAE